MYGKIFDSMFRGSLHGDWKAIVTFQQLIVLADSEGKVDYSVQALSGITSIPIEILKSGIDSLTKPDKNSRSKASEGRRIKLIDSSKDWGWEIVNHRFYRDLVSKIDKKKKDALRIKQKRDEEKKKADVNFSGDENQDYLSKLGIDFVSKFKKNFPEINLEVELKKMRVWLKLHPERRFGKKFFNNWIQNNLNNQKNQGGKNGTNSTNEFDGI